MMKCYKPSSKLRDQFSETNKGLFKTDRLCNVDIMDELQVLSINDTIQKYCLEWSGHLDRMEGRRLPKVSYRNRPIGTRDVGRSRARWRDTL